MSTTTLRGLQPKSTSIIDHFTSLRRQHLAPPARLFHTTPPCTTGRDLLARFRAPPRAPRLLLSPTRDVPFETISTTPAGTSFQDVPNPALDSASKITFPIPAMKEPSDASAAAVAVPIDPAMSRGVMDVLGVKVPPKPRPPGEEECCMSGCVHCVYTIYADDLVSYTSALDTALEALRKGDVPEVRWPDELRAHVAEKDGAGEGGEKITEQVVLPAVDPTMAAFLALESKLKKKQAPESSAATP